MMTPVQITFRNTPASEAVGARIRAEAAKLDRYYDRITSCRVLVEAPHRHHKWGEQFHVRIELNVPGADIVVRHQPSLRSTVARSESAKWAKHLEAAAPHKDISVTIRDTFKAVRRRLEDYARRQRGDVKFHARIPSARAFKLMTEERPGVSR